MVEVTFHYTGQLAAAAGRGEESLGLEPGATLGGVLKILAGRHGEGFGSLMLHGDGRMRATLLAAIDGVQVTGDRENRVLDDVRTVMLMTPIAGG